MKKILFLLLVIPNILFSQRVQLTGIPGQKDDMDINNLLNQIMEPYYYEITNLYNKKIDEQIKLELLNDFKTNVDNFDRVNRYIYGYESAFRTLTNQNSNPELLDIQVERNAKHGDYKIQIQQLAQNDAFSSAPININQNITSGTFSVIANNFTNIIKFLGGNIDNLENILRQKLSNNIDIKLIHTSSDTKTLIFHGKKEGAESNIDFNGDLTPLLDIQLLTTGRRQETNITWDTLTSNIIISNTSIQKDIDYLIEKNTSLNFQVESENIITPKNNTQLIALSTLPEVSIGGITNSNIIIPGVLPILNDISNKVENNSNIPSTQLVILTFNDNTEEQIDLITSNYSISLDNYLGGKLSSINIISEDSISKISDILITTTPEGALQAYHSISKAQDALITLDGVEITRDNNNITNLLTGITLNLLKASEEDIHIKIQPDIELIRDTILQWVVEYNNIIEEIYNFTTIPLEKIGKIKPLHQRKKDEEDLKEGTFYGNSSLLGFKDRLRRLVGTPHNDDPNSIALLDQIGIYIKRYNSFNNDPDSLRKGTLSVNTAELEKMLNSTFDSVYKLFFNDKNGDNIGDLGISISASEVNKLMIGGQGYLTRVQQDSGRKVQDLNKNIAKKEDSLERTERKERTSLLQMSQAIAASKAQNESLRQRFGY